MGSYKKGMDGKIIFDDREDNESDDNDLSKKLNKELERRKGKNNKPGQVVAPPPKPSKNVEFDYDDDDNLNSRQVSNNRHDNIDTDDRDMSDAFAAFNKIKGKNGANSVDDDMMKQMLEKIG